MYPAGALVPLPEPSVVIHLNGSAATVSLNAEDGINFITLRIWLQAVNKQISKSTLEIMKLSLLGDKKEKRVQYDVLDRAKEPSDIFNALEKCLGSKEAAVQRFIYALKRVGHRRNGYVCVRAYKEIIGEDPPPKFEARNETEHFGLCQCLADICVKIKEYVSKALIRYCGRYLLSPPTNPENIPSLAYMLTAMYHDNLITPQDQEKLAIALTVVNANDCVDCIQKYRLKYKYDEIKIEEHKVKHVIGKPTCNIRKFLLHVNNQLQREGCAYFCSLYSLPCLHITIPTTSFHHFWHWHPYTPLYSWKYFTHS